VLGDSFHDDSPRPKSPGLTCLHLTKMTFYHPGRKAKITVTSKPPAAMADAIEGRRDWSRPLHAALTRRLACVVDRQTDSLRLLTGDVEDVKGVVAEKYGQAVILQVRRDDPALTESLPDIARWYRDTLDVEAVYVKRFVKDRSGVDDKPPSSLHSPKPLAGKRMPPEIEIRERGLKFAIRLHEGFSVGLFLDQRENRARVRKTAGGKDVLNLFSYTCGFSVAAASGGASSTVSVDISPKHLEWGKANFALNSLDLSNHQFICSDAADYFKRARRQGKQFDLIIIDAPTFAHGRQRKQSFSIAKDLPFLIASGAELLRPGGQMMISTNNRKLSMPRFKELINEGAGTRHYRITSTPRLPPDFAIDREHAKTIFVRFE
jgi:23S rRNA (cytosine1962-C5)-methyltransferase